MLNQDKLISNAKDLYTLGSGSLKYWIACNGVDPDTYLSLMDEELQENIFDKFKPHMTSFVMNNDTNEAGRSKKDDSELTDSGIQTRTNGSNQLQRQNK
jgi:hypothetical protein